MDTDIITPPPQKRKWKVYIFSSIVLCVLILAWVFIFSSPQDQVSATIHIESGQSIRSVSDELFAKRVVRSPKVLESIMAFLGKDKSLEPGDYYFEKSQNLLSVALQLARSKHNIDPIKITIPEGVTNQELASILSKKMPLFDQIKFDTLTNNLQGKLFPSTYFFYPLSSTEEVVKMLRDTFDTKTKNLLAKGYKDYSENEILTMASIVEEEANGDNDRAIIAGILWKRYEKGMMLQVDVARETYKQKGLPTAPIANFGLESLRATVEPADSEYLFYLHAKDGSIHLAKTYTEHKNNIKKYLK